MDYPYVAPVILTDTLFTAYGGAIGASSAGQRAASFLSAEILATQAIGTFLVPTVVTGTFQWPVNNKIMVLPHHHILGIYSAIPYSPECSSDCDLLAGSACTFQQDGGQWGYIILRDTTTLFSPCCPPGLSPISVQISYMAGLVSGTSYLPTLLVGLTKVAQMILNEIIDPGANEGGEGDPGVTSFSTQGHMEVRKGLGNTALGNSASMNFANRMFSSFRPKRCLKLGW